MSLEPPKILYLINSLPQVGPVNVLEALIRGLDRREIEPHILVLRSEDPNGHDIVFTDLGVSVTYLRCSYWQLELRTAWVAKQVAQYADRLGVRILHLHGYHPDLIGGLLSGRYITISTQHNISKEDYIYSKGRLIGSYMNARLWQSLSRHTALVGITEYVSSFIRSQHPTGDIYTIYNGIDTSRFCPMASKELLIKERKRLLTSLPTDAEVWLICGSLSRLKDPMTAVRAFVHLLSVGKLTERDYLVLLGDGPLRSEIERQVGELFCERILLLGFRSNVEEYLRVANYLIAPSHSEGFGLNVVEGLCSALVPVVSDIPAHCELLEAMPRLRELTFCAGDVHALGERMLQAKGQRLTEEEYNSTLHSFSQESMAQQYTNLYRSLLSEGEL